MNRSLKSMLSFIRPIQRRFYRRNVFRKLTQLPVDPENLPPPSAGESGYPKPEPQGINPLHANYLTKNEFQPPRYRLHCNSTRNNIITTLTQPNGNTIAWFSGGSCEFKKSHRASYEAGYQCAVRMFKRIEDVAKEEVILIDLFLKGFGQGREALQKALLSTEGERVRDLIYTVTDKTPLKIGGTRAKKARRL